MKLILPIFIIFLKLSLVDPNFYMGMFQKNDILVADDRLFKERNPYSRVWAKYGRNFKCPITYVRVVDRLAVRGLTVEVIRGGLRRRYIVMRLGSAYGTPISVNIYVGCNNRLKLTPKLLQPKRNKTDSVADNKTDNTTDSSNNTDTGAGNGPDGDDGASPDGAGNSTDDTTVPPTTAPQ